MNFKLYKLTFQSAHFGEGNLDDTSATFTASRLYSALVLEAIKMSRLDEFRELSLQDTFVLSDAFPFKETPYLPKPIGYPVTERINHSKDMIERRKEAKKAKKLAYIRLEDFSSFLAGNIVENRLGHHKVVVTKNQPLQDGNLYQVSSIHYENASSLYIIVNHSPLLHDLMESLQYSGLGGKRSSGYGRFELEVKDVPSELLSKLTTDHQKKVMSLTTSLPIEEELQEIMETGKYLLKKSSGFTFSQRTTSNYRKQDIYTFKSGSTFNQTYKGIIKDIRPSDVFEHPVWHFAKPLFYKLEG